MLDLLDRGELERVRRVVDLIEYARIVHEQLVDIDLTEYGFVATRGRG